MSRRPERRWASAKAVAWQKAAANRVFGADWSLPDVILPADTDPQAWRNNLAAASRAQGDESGHSIGGIARLHDITPEMRVYDTFSKAAAHLSNADIANLVQWLLALAPRTWIVEPLDSFDPQDSPPVARIRADRGVLTRHSLAVIFASDDQPPRVSYRWSPSTRGTHRGRVDSNHHLAVSISRGAPEEGTQIKTVEDTTEQRECLGQTYIYILVFGFMDDEIGQTLALTIHDRIRSLAPIDVQQLDINTGKRRINPNRFVSPSAQAWQMASPNRVLDLSAMPAEVLVPAAPTPPLSRTRRRARGN